MEFISKKEAITEAKQWRDDMSLPSECPFASEAGFVKAGSQTGRELVSKNKPEFYGRLARVIDPIIKAAHKGFYAEGGFRISDRQVIPIESVEKKKLSVVWFDSLGYFVEKEIQDVKDDEDLQNKKILQSIIDARNPHLNAIDKQIGNPTTHNSERQKNLPRANTGGAGTAVSVIENLVERSNSFLLKDGVKNPKERKLIIEKSHGLLIKIASLHMLKLEALQDQYMPSYAENYFKNLLPFELLGGGALRFSSLDNLQAVLNPKDDIELSGIGDVQRIKLSDIELPDIEIGCPFLLNPGQAKLLWRWGVDLYDKVGLFDDKTGDFDLAR